MQFTTWLLIAVVGTVIVSESQSAISYLPPSMDPAHAGKCWNPITKTPHIPGPSFTDKTNCIRVSCNKALSMSLASCGTVGTINPCRVIDGNLTLDYPNCCPRISCESVVRGTSTAL